MCWVKGKKKVSKSIAQLNHSEDPAVLHSIVLGRTECPPSDSKVKLDYY